MSSGALSEQAWHRLQVMAQSVTHSPHLLGSTGGQRNVHAQAHRPRNIHAQVLTIVHAHMDRTVHAQAHRAVQAHVDRLCRHGIWEVYATIEGARAFCESFPSSTDPHLLLPLHTGFRIKVIKS